ncbi:MAG: glutathione S-transferase family protein [Gammaproteobacteria bacterium]|nr:glutathione S-transferase family protein [Gammaproteobacteria bacterium]
MKPVLILGNKNYSSWSLRAWLALRKAGIEFDEFRIPLFTPEGERLLAEETPAGLVPVLVDGEITVWDSLAIAEYAAEKEPALWPESRAARATARAVAAEMHAGFAALRRTLPMNCRARGRRVAYGADVDADIRRVEQVWCDCRTRYGRDGPWLFGRFSIADAMYAPVASRFATYGIEGPQVVRDYVGTVLIDPDVGQWYLEAAEEPEVIEEEEVGHP